MSRNELIQETDRLCGFSMQSEGTEVWRIDNQTGKKRQLTSPEGNWWASVNQMLEKQEIPVT